MSSVTLAINTDELANELVDGACTLAEQGFRIIPLREAGKKPQIKEWQKQATTSLTRIKSWWRKWPQANIGVATGEGLLVVDLDSEEALLTAEEMGLPDTVTVATSRGLHLYYRGQGRTGAGLRKGIDIRGNGGYVVAPPSIHPSGRRYEWFRDLSTPMAEAPEWALGPAKLKRDTPANGTRKVRSVYRADSLGEGERNEFLFKLGCGMRSIGMSDAEVDGALRIANEERCTTPLDEDEITALSSGVCKFPPGRQIDKTLLSLKLGPYSTTIYLAIRASCNYKAECFRSYDSLGEQTGMNRKTVMKYVEPLVEEGLLEIEHREPPECNVYRLLDPDADGTMDGLGSGTTETLDAKGEGAVQ